MQKLIPSSNISKLDLSNQGLTKIPEEIFELTNLQSLNLSNNKLSQVSADITKLKRLRKLDISNNNITNFYSKICQLPKLEVLNANNNHIKTIPIQIKSLTELKVLSIANNSLSILPNEIKELKKLRKINISKNFIEDFPKILLELKELKSIWLNNLKLNSFPSKLIIDKLRNLNGLYCFSQIFNNDLIDEDFYKLSKIKGNCFPELLKITAQTKILEKQDQIIKPKIDNSVNEMKKKKIFISYSHQDKNWLEEVQTNLKVLRFSYNDFEVWDDTKIHSGEKWKDEIEKALRECRIAILIVSTSFLASDFIQNNELPPLLKKAEEDGTVILPLIVGHCRFTKDENLKIFQSVNNPGKPLISCTKGEIQKILVDLTEDVERSLKS